MSSDRAALLWDESYIWGLMAYRSLRDNGLAFDLISAEDIKAGALAGYGTLMVPGGWASNKIEALGPGGSEAIREFVTGGGSYVGICGGAGLATSDGLGLVSISRRPTSQRVPSLSGPVRLALREHPVWEGAGEPVFNVWWPSQFVLEDTSISVLAEFGSATDDAMSSDLRVGDIDDWSGYEEAYGLNLDPSRMSGEPVVIEARSGRGRALLSLVHFDTPGDTRGGRVLRNIWKYTGAGLSSGISPVHPPRKEPQGALFDAARRPFELGLERALWHRRGYLIGWRRGVRGLEYFTLYALARELGALGADTPEESSALVPEIEEFSLKACQLLTLEHEALGRGEGITFRKASGADMASLRSELFSSSKSHGGRFRYILGRLDSMLFRALRNNHLASGNP